MGDFGYWGDSKKTRIEFERILDEKLAAGDADDISATVTPQSLGRCNTNILLKAFEVSGYLQCQVRQERADVEELLKLANSVDEFIACLIDPLKSDSEAREAFGDSLDLIVDKAIEHKQMKFLTHPVVFNLLDKRWRGRFSAYKQNFLKWTLLRLWTLVDVFLFPFLFAVLFIVHSITDWRRKYKDLDICFILNATSKTGSDDFRVMKSCASYIIRKCGYRSANYCVIGGDREDTSKLATFEPFTEKKTTLVKNIPPLERSISCRPKLHDDLHEAVEAFGGLPASRETSIKIMFLFINPDVGSCVPAQKGKLHYEAETLKSMGVKIVSVAVGQHPALENLEPVVRDGIIRCGQHEDSSKLGKKLLREIDGMDLYELYLAYFTTPYFIFARDTLSYLVLLGLHVALCISSSTIPFTVLEWAILVFFSGRLFLEVNQYIHNSPKQRQSTNTRSGKRRKYGYYQSGSDKPEVTSPIKLAISKEKKTVFGVLDKYFSDRWNVLDFVTLLVYFVTVTLRMVTWAVYSSVPGNRALVIAGYLYGLNASILTLRVFGSLLEASKGTGTTHIALVSIVEDVAVILVQFLVGILSSSLAITKVLLAERSYLSGDKGSPQEKRFCSNTGFSCWFDTARHLGWTLLGMTDLEPFTSGDTFSDYLAQLLYGGFIIIALILLVNMMIAILSNTYERVKNNSLKEWSFKKAISVRTYSNYHPIPVPWNLLSQSAMMLIRRFQASRCNNHSQMSYKSMSDLETSDEEASDLKIAAQQKDEALDQMVEQLMSAYFALYGWSFPLTEENKMNNILSETQRNREMCNQIARKVFCDHIQAVGDPPVGSNAWKSAGIQIDGCLLTYVGRELCKTCKIILAREFHGARYKQPFSKRFPKMEVLIQEDGKKREINVGVVRVKHDLHESAGETTGTVGYFAQDGRVLYNASGSLEVIDGRMAYRGDLIACSVNFDKVENDKIPIVFTLNGNVLAEILIEYEKGKRDLFPFIRMGHKGTRVLAKMCPGDVEVRGILKSAEAVGKEATASVSEEKESHDVQLQKLQQKMDDMFSMIETQDKKVDNVFDALNHILHVLQGLKTVSPRVESSGME